MNNKNIHTYFWILTIAFLIILTLPRLLMDGMFLDGVLYSAISHNFAKGYGDFWHPHFSKLIYNFFDQQPPLFFAIQGWFFRIFGDSIYVERAYSFAFCILNALLISIIWHLIFINNNKLKKYCWLPVLLWIIIPVCNWGFCNNIIENTMSCFCLTSIVFSMLAINEINKIKAYTYLLFSALFIFLASLTKGFQGTFVLTFPFIVSICTNKISLKKGFLYSLLLLIIPSLIYFILLQNKEIYDSLTTYLKNRVINSIRNVSTTNCRLYLLYRLFTELLPSVTLCLIIIYISYRKKKNLNIFIYKKELLTFLLLGLAGSLPLMITKEQRGFYLNTSFPYFAISLTLLIVSEFEFLLNILLSKHKIVKIFKIFSIVFLIASIILSANNFKKTGRDKELLHDVYALGKIIPHGSIICANPEMLHEWTFQSYMIRHFYISLNLNLRDNCKFILIQKEKKYQVPENYHETKINLKMFRLYENKDIQY
ncbi:MAG: glycosyltransferase family 39 protein [Bacteroidales bacterium]|nr:glycosyltransferase family 39 protein [Bacteroidales bacterium]